MKRKGKSVSVWGLGGGKTGLKAWEEREGVGVREREISECGWSWESEVGERVARRETGNSPGEAGKGMTVQGSASLTTELGLPLKAVGSR